MCRHKTGTGRGRCRRNGIGIGRDQGMVESGRRQDQGKAGSGKGGIRDRRDQG
jgi:hypothetical protein